MTGFRNTPTEALPRTARMVRAARAYACLTGNELADRLGIGVETLKRIENGRRLARTTELLGIAQVCGVPREWFEVDPSEIHALSARLADFLEGLSERLTAIETRLTQIEARLDGHPAHTAAGPSSAVAT